MKAMKTVLTIACLFISQWMLAQSIQIQVSADKVSVGESFLVTYTIEGDVDDFTLPEFKDFKVFQSGKSTNMSIINGKISKSVGYNITVVPLSVGVFEIAPAKAVINGKKVSSSSFTIEVVADNTQPRTQNNSNKIDAPTDHWKDNILLLAEADKQQIYVGEQITVTYKLLRRLDFQSMEVEKMPVFKGFLSEEMEIPAQQSEGVMEYKGHKFYYQAFRKVALFGAQPGLQSIDPLIARGVILVPERDPFFGTTIFSTTQPKMVVITSNTLKIDVLPLPVAQQPSNFSGAVGQFSAQRKLQHQQLKQGDATTMTIEVSGWGNLKAISPLTLKNHPSIEIFDPEIHDTPRKNGENYGGVRTFQYSIVPEKSGQIILPKEEFVYFDPQKKSYITQELPEIQLQVSEQLLTSNEEEVGQFFSSNIKKNLTFNDHSNATPIAIALASGMPFLAVLLGLAWWKNKEGKNVEKPKLDVQLGEYIEGNKESFSYLAKDFREKMKSILNVKVTTDEELFHAISDESIKQKAQFVLHSCDRAAFSPLVVSSIKDLKQLAEEVLLKLNNTHTS